LKFKCDALDIKDNTDAIRTLRTNYESIWVDMKDVISTDTLQTDDVTISYPISDSLERLQETTITNYESIGVDIKGVTSSYPLQTAGGMHEMNVVTETGLYDIVLCHLRLRGVFALSANIRTPNK
jgi:hypothetical protein